MAAERIDVVVFGATGFTGQFVVESLARSAAEGRTRSSALTWAVAGRNRQKLEACLAEASKHVDRDVTSEGTIIVADVKDEESLNEMCRQAKVLISCVGPYRFYGEPVVKACVAQGCHYVDICGEPQVLEDLQKKYHKAAVEAGVHIVQTCGFDSIPADLGVAYTIDQFPGFVTQIESYHWLRSSGKGAGVHTGTWSSLVHSLANRNELRTKRGELATPFEWQGPRLKRKNLFFSKDTNKWSMLFPGSDAAVVRRSQRARQDEGKHPVQYGAYIIMENFLAAVILTLWGLMLYMLTSFRWGVSFADKHPSLLSFGTFSEEGPSRKKLAASTFSTTFFARGFKEQSAAQRSAKPDVSLVTRVSGPECGYIATSEMAVQSALSLLREKLAHKGGVLTPAVAFEGTELISNLDKHGIQFSVVSKQE